MSKMMSSMLEKTMEQTLSLLRGNSVMQSESSITLRDLEDVIIATNRSMHMKTYRMKIRECIDMIKRKSQDLHLTMAAKRECLLIIAHLGNINEEIDSVHPFVIKCIEDARTVSDRHLGYTVLVLLNKSRQTSVYLAVNTMLKDISSSSNAIASTALTALASLIDLDLIPVFLPAIEKLLKSGTSTVRHKALMVLHSMVRVGPEYLVSVWDTMIRSLCDRDPHIMSGCLPIIETLLGTGSPPVDMKMLEKVIFVLKQVEQGRLPIDMMHGGVCAPWVQIRLIRIIRMIPKEHYIEQNFLQLQETFTNIFARFQIANYVQFAIITECIRTIVAFHPKLAKLESAMLDTIDKALTTNNPNLLLTGVETLKIVVTIKPGYSKRYTETLLKNLSDRNPSLVKAILQLLEDLASADDHENIVSVLVEKLPSVTNAKFRKDILCGILRIFEKFPVKEEWMLNHYLPLLANLEYDLDFPIIKKLMMCMESLSMEAMKNEASRLCKSLQGKFTALQYCMVLEILIFYHEKISNEDCEKATRDILQNCWRKPWKKTVVKDILMFSWSCIVVLMAHHDFTINMKELLKTKSMDVHSSALLEQQFSETVLFLKNPLLTKSISSDSTPSDIDPNLSFLDEYTKENDSAASSGDDEPCGAKSLPSPSVNVLMRPKESNFKTNPYSKSRFDTTQTPTDNEVKSKNKFFDKEGVSTSTKPQTVWNKSDYVLDTEQSEKD